MQFNYVALETNQDNAQFSALCNKFRELVMPSYNNGEVRDFLTKGNLRFLCAVLAYDDNNQLAGFTTMGFYHRIINGKEIVIARMATGVEQSLRGRTMQFETMWEKMDAYKKLIGDVPMYFAGYIANPLMYNAVCENTWEYYPRLHSVPPPEITELLKEFKKVYITDGSSDNDFTFYAPFSVNVDNQVQLLINNSSNENVLYFREVCPHYLDQQILIVIVPLTKENICKSLEKVQAKKR